MSKTGPLRHRKSKTSARDAQNAQVGVNQFNDILNMLKSFEERVNHFIDAASEQAPPKRLEQIQLFRQNHPEMIGKEISGFLAILLEVLQTQLVKYESLREQHAQMLGRVIEIQPQDEQSFLAEIAKANKLSEPELLKGYANTNVLQAFLSSYLNLTVPFEPQLKSSRDLVLKLLFLEVSQANSFLINRYLLAQLTIYDYYFYYQLFCEKVEWLLLYGNEYQDVILKRLIEDPSNDNESWYDAHFFLQFYKDSISFCILVKLPEKVLILSERLEDLLTQLTLQCAKTKHKYSTALEEAISAVYIQKTITENQQNAANNDWLIYYFRQLDNFIQNKNIDEMTAVANNEESFQVKCETIRLRLIELNSKDHELSTRIGAFYDLLELLKLYSNLSNTPNRKDLESEKALLNTIISAIMTMTKCEEKSYIVLTVKAAFKLLADNLKEKLLNKPKEPAVETNQNIKDEIKQISEDFSALQLAPAKSEVPEMVITSMQATKDDELAKQQRKLEKKLANEKKKQNRNFEKDKTALEETHRQQLVELQRAHEKEKKRYNESLQTQLTSLKSTFENEISARKQQLSDQAVQSQAHLAEQIKTVSERLNAEHEKALQQLDVQHANKLKASLERLEREHQQQKSAILAEHQQIMEARRATLLTLNENTVTARQSAHAAEIASLQNHSKPQSAIVDVKPFAQIVVAPEVRFIMSLLEKNFECYLGGGWVRNRLRGIQPHYNEDFDLIVNATPEELPNDLLSQCTSNPLQPNLLKLGKIEFWCVPWENLRLALLKRDFTINTFICTSKGDVYDLLSVKDDLNVPLKILGIAKSRYEDDPTLILRHIRFSNQLQMPLSEKDIKYLKRASCHLTKLPVSYYLSSLQAFFQCQSGIANYAVALQMGMLNDLFPFLSRHLPTQLVNDFWIGKLQHFAQFDNVYNHYHLLALFMLLPVMANEGKAPLEDVVEQCLGTFFITYQAGIAEADQIKIRKTIKPILLNKPETANEGEYGLYWQLKSFIQFNTQRNPTFTPLYQMGQRPQTPPIVLPATTQVESKQVRNGSYLG